jgi:hypothetical protein
VKLAARRPPASALLAFAIVFFNSSFCHTVVGLIISYHVSIMTLRALPGTLTIWAVLSAELISCL